jgi:hypothetical protein
MSAYVSVALGGLGLAHNARVADTRAYACHPQSRAYVSIRQHTLHTSAYLAHHAKVEVDEHTSAYVSIRQHT